MDILQLQEFKSLVRTLSYSETAYELNVSTSSLSRHIQQLEAELGGTLFERNTRSISVTPFGTMFLQHAIGILREYEKGIDEARRYLAQDSRSLVFGVVDSSAEYSPASYVMDFERTHPGCSVQIVSGTITEMERGFKEGQFNVYTAVNNEQIEELRFLKVGDTSIKAVVPESSPFAGSGTLSLHDLAEHNLCISRRGTPFHDSIIDYYRKQKLTPYIIFAGRFEDSISQIRNGRGIGLFLFRLGREPQVEGLRLVDIDPEISFEYGFGYRDTLSAVEELFIEHMRKLTAESDFEMNLDL